MLYESMRMVWHARNMSHSLLPRPPETGVSGDPPPLASANRIGPARAHSLHYTYTGYAP